MGLQFIVLGHIVDHDRHALRGLVGIFERRQIETPVLGAELWVVVGNFKTHHRFIGLAHGGQVCLQLQRKSLIQSLADQIGIALPQDGLGRAVAHGNLILHIRGQYPAGNGSEDIFHQVLEFGHLGQGAPDRCE